MGGVMRQLGTRVIVVALLTLVGSRADAALPGLAPPPDLLAGGPRDMYEVRLGKPPRGMRSCKRKPTAARSLDGLPTAAAAWWIQRT